MDLSSRETDEQAYTRQSCYWFAQIELINMDRWIDARLSISPCATESLASVSNKHLKMEFACCRSEESAALNCGKFELID